MRIAWISFDFDEYCVVQANALAADHEVMLVLASDRSEEIARYVDARVRFEPFPRHRLRQPIQQLGTCRAIVRRVVSFKPDVVHFQHGHFWFNPILPLLRRFPLVVTIHDPRHHHGDGDSSKTPQALMDFGYRRADHVIVHGRSHVTVVRDEIGIPEDRIHVIPHVAIGGMVGLEDVSEDPRSVLFFGRIWAYKGLEYLIRSEPLIAEECLDVSITIAGEGDDFGRYRQMMENPDRFVVRNLRVSDEERSRLFQRAALVVLPYVSASQSGVVPVAYTHGKPVVATRVGSMFEYIEHGVTGLLVPPRDEHALAEAVLQLLRDPDLRRRMGRQGQAKLMAECGPEVVGRSTLEVYRRAIEDARQSSPPGIEGVGVTSTPTSRVRARPRSTHEDAS